jgi:hypothetical protein
MLRRADYHERLRAWGTEVRLKLREDPLSLDGLFKTDHRRLSRTELLHGRVKRLCALSDTDIAVCGPDDEALVKVINGGDWITIPPDELFRRLYRKEEESHLDRMILDGYEKLFVDRATNLVDETGVVVGRGMMATGWESVYPDMYWLRPPEGHVYVGGLHADELEYCMGAFVGDPLTADRLRAFPSISIPRFQQWLGDQAAAVQLSAVANDFERWMTGYLVRGFGVEAPTAPCAMSVTGKLNRDQIVRWLDGRDEVLLVAASSLNWLDRPDTTPLFITFEGRAIEPPDGIVFVALNPSWLFPEEVLPKPRDERFADADESRSGWDVRAWWYDTGNFGAPGLVVQTIAEVWGIDIETAVALMEPLHMQDDRDHRPLLPTLDGHGVRVTAIRMRRPAADCTPS